MKRHVLLCLPVAAMVFCQLAVAESEVVHGYPVETEHLTLVLAEQFDQHALGKIELKAKQLYRKTLEFVHDEPDDKVKVVFRGRARVGPDQRSDYPLVDSEGVIHLFRFTDDFENYFHAFVHELVHALRIDRVESADWFFEEGFAEFVRLRVYEPMQGFPWHGFSPSVVAAGHIVEGSAIPLEALRERHEQLNRPCRAQAYALRAAFFEWLGDKFGDQKLLNMSQEPLAGQEEHYVEYFGLPFSTLAADWQEDMRTQHDAEKFSEYQTSTPIVHIPLCEPNGAIIGGVSG